MRSIIDRVLLFLTCSFFLFLDGEPYQKVLAFFLGLTVAALTAGVEQKIFSLVCCIAYLIASTVAPFPLFAYIPVMTYQLFSSYINTDEKKVLIDRDFYIPAAFVLLTCLLLYAYGFYGIDLGTIYLFCMLLFTSAHVAICTKNHLKITDNFEHQQNVSRGMEILMQKRQEDFEKQQDSEVHLATLKERNRIAREIHDNVGHMLSRALLLIGALEVVNKEPALIEPIGNLKNTLSEAMENVRESVHDLHDESIELEATIRSITEEFTFCPVELDLDAGKYMNKDTKYCIISIIKEALSNTAKHSNANLVKITLRSHDTRYQLLIEDNGNVSINSDGTGIGLESMRERTKALNGTIYMSGDNGYRIFATFPKK